MRLCIVIIGFIRVLPGVLSLIVQTFAVMYYNNNEIDVIKGHQSWINFFASWIIWLAIIVVFAYIFLFILTLMLCYMICGCMDRCRKDFKDMIPRALKNIYDFI